MGVVSRVQDGVAKVNGLSDVKNGELVQFTRSGVRGVVMGLFKNSVQVSILGNEALVRQGDFVERTHEVASVTVCYTLLGGVVDALGNRIDGGVNPTTTGKRVPVEARAPGVIARAPVTEPLSTGILALDSMVPVGRGQRQLIIGDRQTGKTTVALDTILNQRDNLETPVFCVYVAIGQKRSSVVQLVNRLKKEGAMFYTVVVAATAAESASLQYLAPYTGTAIAEYFREGGFASLIVYDDLTKHANAYRQMSLLLRRSPGREAYPSDVFYVHARLLERSGRLNAVWGSGSLTALPIVETLQGDVSAFIPTNVISITDGQTFLDAGLFNRDIRPAINVGLSVSRVGAAAQPRALKEVSRALKLDLAQFREVESYKSMAGDLDASTRDTLARGARLQELLKQNKHSPMHISTQVVLLYAGTNGYCDAVSLKCVEAVKYFTLRLAFRRAFESFVLGNKALVDSEKFLKTYLVFAFDMFTFLGL